jgi:pimeloyl-ACP methyl ester carboxylesterase
MLARSVGAISVLIATAGMLGGCSTLLAVGKQQERADRNAIISGTVTTDHYEARGPLVVGLAARNASGGFVLVDHFVAERPGPWIFGVEPGTYWLGAFEDANRDRRYDDEPALRPDPEHPVILAPGQQLHGIALRIPREGRLPRSPVSLQDLEARAPGEQKRVSAFAFSAAGAVTTLDDPRFDREVATKGMWQYYDFLLEGRPGIYFLEPYDPTKIPVLFVHGIAGTPQEFRFLIDALDRTRFQPWVFYYGSGARLEVVATILTQLFVRLRHEYGFTRAAVVAHSMGGLVTREFLLQDYELNGTQVVRTYVTISSPLGGMASAAEGVQKSPVVLRSWYGLSPDGAYLNGLFFKDGAKTARRRLPEHIAYHLLFGFRGGGPDGSGDGIVSVASQLRAEAQEEARSQRGFDEDHASILRSPAVAARVNAILEELR